MINKTLSHYKILELLGRGGMGEVYRATDSKLGRDVALKILPREFSEDPERRARFEREARSLATLQHANVASVYDFEEADGVRFLVMELVEGEELGAHIARGVTVDEAVSIATQIAQGLEAAHDKGIVHRDLKPANVQISSGGMVKLLDFGLARAWASDDDANDPANSPTITSNMTAAGMVMGTAAYMSPEQARGKTVDRQADVWAFGCVFYEILAGKSAFAGETITDTLAAIIHKDPDWTALPETVPAQLLRLLKLCLQKAPADRLRDARDIRLLLNAPPEESPAVPTSEAAPVAPSTASRIWPALAALLAIALVVVLLVGRTGAPNDTVLEDAGTTTPPTPRVTGLTQLTDHSGEEYDPSLSPDGRMLLFRARDNGDDDIFLQRVGGEKPINLTADHDGSDIQPAFSADGQRIAFSSSREGGGVFVMGATGETPLRITDFGFDPAWSPDGRSLVITEERVMVATSRTSNSKLWVVDVDSRQKRTLPVADGVGPNWSPNGHRIAFWSYTLTVNGQRDIYTIPVDGGDAKAVTLDAATDWDPVWSADGRWLYFVSDRGGSPDLWRQRIDEVTGETSGSPQAVTLGMTQITQVSIARNGNVAITSLSRSTELLRVPFDISSLAVTGPTKSIYASNQALIQDAVSEDGEWVAYRTSAPNEHIYIMRSDGTARRRIVGTEHRNRGPRFYPGTDWILFYSNRTEVYQVWAVRRDGSGLRRISDNEDYNVTSPRISSDGRILASYDTKDGKVLGELKLPPGGIDALEGPIAFEPIMEETLFSLAEISPDGRWMTGFDASSGMRLTYDSQSGKVKRVQLDGEPRTVGGTDVWLDEGRILTWDLARDSAVAWDVETHVSTVVENLPGPSNFLVLQSQDALLVNRIRTDTQIWMLTLKQ